MKKVGFALLDSERRQEIARRGDESAYARSALLGSRRVLKWSERDEAFLEASTMADFDGLCVRFGMSLRDVIEEHRRTFRSRYKI